MSRGYRLKINGEYVDEGLLGYEVLDDGEFRAEGSPSLGWSCYMYIPLYCETCNVEVVKGMMGCHVDKYFFCSECFPNGLVRGTITYD